MNRERLTITLRSDLLKALDAEIDGQSLRNRSHAIEYFLSRSLGLKSVKVLILAGGKPVYPHNFDVESWESLKKEKSSDSKVSSKTEVKVKGVNIESEKKALPKAMVKIAGRPLLEQTLLRLKAAKMTDVYISVGEGGESIENYFGDGSQIGLNITYIRQPAKNKGNAQPLLQAKKYFNEAFLLLYGDVLSDIDFGDFVEFHRGQKTAVCTMALTSAASVDMWGLAKLQGNHITAFEEKPQNPKTFSRLINAGIYMMQPEIFSYITAAAGKLESHVFPRLVREGRLFGYAYEGLWLDISSSAAYRQAVKELKG